MEIFENLEILQNLEVFNIFEISKYLKNFKILKNFWIFKKFQIIQHLQNFKIKKKKEWKISKFSKKNWKFSKLYKTLENFKIFKDYLRTKWLIIIVLKALKVKILWKLLDDLPLWQGASLFFTLYFIFIITYNSPQDTVQYVNIN